MYEFSKHRDGYTRNTYNTYIDSLQIYTFIKTNENSVIGIYIISYYYYKYACRQTPTNEDYKKYRLYNIFSL